MHGAGNAILKKASQIFPSGLALVDPRVLDSYAVNSCPQTEFFRLAGLAAGAAFVLLGSYLILERIFPNPFFWFRLPSLCPRLPHAFFRITNTGPEIPEEHANLIFERFYRVDISRSAEIHGSGLGLTKYLPRDCLGPRTENLVGATPPGVGRHFPSLYPFRKQARAKALQLCRNGEDHNPELM